MNTAERVLSELEQASELALKVDRAYRDCLANNRRLTEELKKARARIAELEAKDGGPMTMPLDAQMPNGRN